MNLNLHFSIINNEISGGSISSRGIVIMGRTVDLTIIENKVWNIKFLYIIYNICDSV